MSKEQMEERVTNQMMQQMFARQQSDYLSFLEEKGAELIKQRIKAPPAQHDELGQEIVKNRIKQQITANDMRKFGALTNENDIDKTHELYFEDLRDQQKYPEIKQQMDIDAKKVYKEFIRGRETTPQEREEVYGSIGITSRSKSPIPPRQIERSASKKRLQDQLLLQQKDRERLDESIVIPESPEEKKIDLDEQTFGPGDLEKLDQGIEEFLMEPKKSSELKNREAEKTERQIAVKKKSEKREPGIEQKRKEFFDKNIKTTHKNMQKQIDKIDDTELKHVLQSELTKKIEDRNLKKNKRSGNGLGNGESFSLKNGMDIDMLEFLIELQISMCRKRENEFYQNWQVIQCIDGEYDDDVDNNSDIIIVIYLEDGHFSIAYIDKQTDCICYFEPLVNEQYREKVIPDLESLSQSLSPENKMIFKANQNKIQSNTGLDKNLCSLYCYSFASDMIDGLSYKESTDFTQQDKLQMLKLGYKFDEI